MSLSTKNIFLVAIVLIAIPVFSRVVHEKLFAYCNDLYAFGDSVFRVFASLTSVNPLVGFVFFVPGFILVLVAYVRLRSASLSKSRLILESSLLTVIVFILLTVWLASFNCARCKGPDAAVKSNISALRAIAEIHYVNSGSYKGMCSQNSEVQVSISEIEKYLHSEQGMLCKSDEQKPVCYDSETHYAISATLPSDGKIFCVDSSGFSGIVKNQIQGASCN